MALANEYQETIKKFNRLPVDDQNDMLKEVTTNQMTSELEDALTNLRSIPGIGPVAGMAILFALGVLSLKYE